MLNTFKLTSLELIYPPISNQEAIWLERDHEFEEVIRDSAFYMIGARHEAEFQNFRQWDAGIGFEVVLGERLVGRVRITPERLGPLQCAPSEAITIDWGSKVVRIWDPSLIETKEGLLDWFTTEKILFERSRNFPGICGLNEYRKALTYDLLYVGIAKEGDTYDRLFKRAHKKRQEILGNELQRKRGARVTDEVYLFAYRLSSTVARTYEVGEDFTDAAIEPELDHRRVIADAEKAFVSLLKPGYNSVKYLKYPRGVDGLHGLHLRAYGYAICENITFRTPTASVHGGRTGEVLTHDADVLFVHNNEALIVRGSRLRGES
jgi:hypothetical protein